nr:MAG TPA: Regulatory protein-modification, helix-turn-helix, transcriptional regulato, DNA [Bacteriophage sp.]
MNRYGEAIRSAIKRSKMPIRVVAERAEISEMTIYQMWGSDKTPRLDTLLRIMNAIGLKSLDELLGLEKHDDSASESSGAPLLLEGRPIGVVRSCSGASVEAVLSRRYCEVERSPGASGDVVAVEVFPY